MRHERGKSETAFQIYHYWRSKCAKKEEKMFEYELNQPGFTVYHNSEPWRVAVHSYQEDVNGLSSFKNWGRHLISQEAFVLLRGRAFLVTSSEGTAPEDYKIHDLRQGVLFVVDTAERHAILLDRDTDVLIMENQDMSASVNEPINASVVEAVSKAWA